MPTTSWGPPGARCFRTSSFPGTLRTRAALGSRRTTPGWSRSRWIWAPPREGSDDAPQRVRDRCRGDCPCHAHGLLYGFPDGIRSPEAPGGTARPPGRLPGVPRERLHGGDKAVSDLPPFDRVHPAALDVRLAGAEPLRVVPRPVVLPDVPRPERGTEAEQEDGGPARPGSPASGGLHRAAPDRRAARPRLVLPVPRKQERCEMPRLPPMRRGVMPTANNARAFWPFLVIVVAVLAAGGCSTSTTTSGFSLVDEQGGHPANFLSTHPGFAVSLVSQCSPCHGDDLKGGIANASCFTAACHHGTKTGWVVFPPGPPQGHGTSAKKKPGSSGFVSCRICHGNDFLGGSVQVTCLSAGCHGGAGQSHNPAQWRSGDTYVNTTTDEGNASVCALCHLAGANSPIGPPSPPAAAGTPPGCFNNTLCHGENPVPHPVGSSWRATPPAAQPHGNSAKATPSSSEGFAYCRVCHGTSTGNYNGGTAQVSCLNVACHVGTGNSPHASRWFQGDTYVHTTTNPGNAPECAFCHFNELNAGNHSPTPPPAGSNPGCFNNTLCHGAGFSAHPAG